MGQQRDDTVRPDVRQNTERIGQGHRDKIKFEKNSCPLSRWGAKDDTRDPTEGRDGGLKNNNNKTKQNCHKNKTKQEYRASIGCPSRHRVAEYGGVPSTW